MTDCILDELWSAIAANRGRPRKTLIFTGAGVSTLSGIKDFRGSGGLYTKPWHGHDVEDILSLHSFRRDPAVFYSWAREFCYCLERFSPNIVHEVIARLEKAGYIDGVVTQNIDVLHQAAGSEHVFEIHGSPSSHHCLKCGRTYDYKAIAPTVMKEQVPKCSCGGIIKPDIVFYGESLDGAMLENCFAWAEECDLCIVLGSSLTVQPAASLPLVACQGGAKLCIVNAQPTPLDRLAAWKLDDLKIFAETISKNIGD